MTVRAASATVRAGARATGLLHTNRPAGSATMRAAARLSVHAPAKDPRAAALLAARPGIAALGQLDQRARDAILARARLALTPERIPASQNVLLTFELDRTSIPYLAERG